MEQRTADEVSGVLRPKESLPSFGGGNSDEEIDFVEDQEDTEDEESCSEDDFEAVSNTENESGHVPDSSALTSRKYVYGKDKYKWCLTVPERRGRRSRLVMHLPGAKNVATTAKSPFDFWNLLFPDEMLQIVLKYTNEEIERYRHNEDSTIATFDNLTLNELKAFIGLMYFAGMKKSNNVPTAELWSTEFGFNLFKSAMSCRRFEFIASQLRFDDKNTRSERRAVDLLAPIRDLWDLFIKNCTDNYTPSDFLTIDEQLLGFRGRFPARVYIKSKPARYGIKIVSLNDAKTFYMYNAVPYIGKVSTQPGESIPSYYVRTLTEPIHNSGRNVTCDNWFSSIEIFNKMYKEYNLTMVGTLRKNKRQIPESFKRNASAGTVSFGYDKQNILLSYCPKKNKVVLLLSPFHKCVKTAEDSDKPEIVDFYNRNKCGTDVFDQLCSNYTCARRTNRWSMRFFMGMLDQAAVNCSTLYNFVPNNEVQSHRTFLKNLSLALITPHLEDRLAKPELHKAITLNISEILSKNVSGVTTSKTDKMEKRKRCFFCKSKKDRRICEDHRLFYCNYTNNLESFIF